MAKQVLNKYQTNDNYSSSEVNTGKKWIDGRAVYRKTITGQISLINGEVNFAHGISGLTSDFRIVSINGGLKLGSTAGLGTEIQQLWYREFGGNWVNLRNISTTNLLFIGSFAWGDSHFYITLEYVK